MWEEMRARRTYVAYIMLYSPVQELSVDIPNLPFYVLFHTSQGKGNMDDAYD